ncbi:hypothetical protein STIAU_0022, partial [Stigmatella aurantiaca DW4/3-1]
PAAAASQLSVRGPVVCRGQEEASPRC